MEFYFARSDYRKNRALVSIPNGMEFYALLSPSLIELISFVSISNGMEFYADQYAVFRRARGVFQFPTGWNYTLLKI